MNAYSTNLTESQYDTILRIIGDKRKRNHSLREIFDAIFYLLKTGCQWRMLPNDFPKWKLVYYYFCKWKREGLFEEINDVLRNRFRKLAGQNVSPSIGIIDSQSVKTTRSGGEDRGFDGGKNVKGRKRHIVTDKNGLLLAVKVHQANTHDSKAGFGVINLLKHRFECMKKIFADGGYRGELVDKVKQNLGWDMEITLRSDKNTDFKPLPKRWVVERTFSWFESYRRLSKDYEFCTDTAEAMVQLAMIKIMLNRIKN